MAQDSELPKAADKGKGKAVDDAKKDKPLANGKKEDDKVEGMGTQLHLWCDRLLTITQLPRKSSTRRISNSRTNST